MSNSIKDYSTWPIKWKLSTLKLAGARVYTTYVSGQTFGFIIVKNTPIAGQATYECWGIPAGKLLLPQELLEAQTTMKRNGDAPIASARLLKECKALAEAYILATPEAPVVDLHEESNRKYVGRGQAWAGAYTLISDPDAGMFRDRARLFTKNCTQCKALCEQKHIRAEICDTCTISEIAGTPEIEDEGPLCKECTEPCEPNENGLCDLCEEDRVKAAPEPAYEPMGHTFKEIMESMTDEEPKPELPQFFTVTPEEGIVDLLAAPKPEPAAKPIVVPQFTDPKTKYLLPSFVGKPLVYSNPKPEPEPEQTPDYPRSEAEPKSEYAKEWDKLHGTWPEPEPEAEVQPEPPKFDVTSANREAWLQRAFEGTLRQWFLDQGYELPSEVRMSCGFTSDGGRKNASIGQCVLATDGIFQIYITARIDDPSRVLDILIHELAHVAMGSEFVQIGHKKLFKQCAVSLGLTGKMTATTASDELVERLKPLIEELGEYPHCKLEGATGGKKKQTTRMIKVECPSCIVDSGRGPKPYSLRMSQGMIDGGGCPSCGICGQTMDPKPPKGEKKDDRPIWEIEGWPEGFTSEPPCPFGSDRVEYCNNMEASDEDPAAIQKRKQSRKFFHLTEWFLRENSLPAKGMDSLYKDLYSTQEALGLSPHTVDLDVWTGLQWKTVKYSVDSEMLEANRMFLAPCFYDEVHSDLTPPKPDRDQCGHCGSTHLPYPNQKTLCRLEGTMAHKLRGNKPEDIGYCLNCLKGDSAYLAHLESLFFLLGDLNNCDQTWNRSGDDLQNLMENTPNNGAFGHIYRAIEKLAGKVILSAWCEWTQFIPELANRGLHYNEEYRSRMKHWKEIYID